MNFSELNINNFLETLSSKDPTPGGGSTAGLSASLSASLLLMVINLTKNNYKLDHYKLELERIRDESQELINEDAQAFQEVMAAYRLPKKTENEKKERSNQIQIALKEASIIPFKTMKLGLRLLQIGKEVIQFGNPNAASDAGVAALMALSAVKGGNYNVMINIKSLKDTECAESMRKDSETIIDEAIQLQKEIESIMMDKLA